MEKQTFKIVLNHDGKSQEKCLRLFALTSQKSKLVTFALTEMIEKYGLDNASEAEIKEFITGYKAISRIKERNHSLSSPLFAGPAPDVCRETPVNVIKETKETAPKPRDLREEKKKAINPVVKTEAPSLEKQAEMNNVSNDDEMDINPSAFAQMMSLMKS